MPDFKELIEKGKTAEAIKLLLIYNYERDFSLYNVAVLLSARY